MPPHLSPELIALILTHTTRLIISDQIAHIKLHYFHCYINYTDPNPNYATVMRDAPGTRAKKALQLVSKDCDQEVRRAWGMLLQNTKEGRILKEMARAMREGRLEIMMDEALAKARMGRRSGRDRTVVNQAAVTQIWQGV